MSSFEPVPALRSTIEPIGGGVELTIPSRRNYLMVAVFIIWLGGWFMGESAAIRTVFFEHKSLDDGHTAFMAFWLIGWTAGGIGVLLAVLWNIAGCERVRFGSDEVVLRKEIYGLGFGRRYDPSKVSNLRVLETSGFPANFGRRAWGVNAAPLAFDYGAQTMHFGAGIDAAEARQLVAKIVNAAPNFGASAV